MSKAVSALPGAAATGFAHVKEMGLTGMITLKADLEAKATGSAVKAALGLDMPAQRGMTLDDTDRAVAWMAPDEVLILCKHAEADALVARLSQEMGDAHHLVVNVSDARAVFSIEARDVREVLGKLTPADLSTLDTQQVCRSRLAQVPAAFWMNGPDHATVICFRSVAQYVFDLLAVSAREGGEVGYYGK